MHTITMTITLSESEARALWESRNSEEPEEGKLVPTGQELTDWVADKAASDLESQWQFDHGIFASVSTEGETNTRDLLEQVALCDYLIGPGEIDAAQLNEAKEERDRLKGELGLNDLPENSEAELDDLMTVYGFGQRDFVAETMARLNLSSEAWEAMEEEARTALIRETIKA